MAGKVAAEGNGVISVLGGGEDVKKPIISRESVMEVIIQNIRSDMYEYIDFFIKETPKGKQFSFQRFLLEQCIFILILSLPIAYSKSQNERLIIFAIFIIIEILYFVLNKFNPRFYAAKRVLCRELKKWSPKEWEIFESQRKIKITSEWLEITTIDSTKQYHWNMVERLANKNDYIFIIIGGPFILPKRDFHSEDNYQEFAEKLLEYWESGKNKPISADLLTDNRE
jgi:hypothetical protein